MWKEIFILMDVNVRPNKARVVTQFPENRGIQIMHCPPKQPNVNVAKHVQDMMGKSFRNLEATAQGLEKLGVALVIARNVCDVAVMKRFTYILKQRY